MNNHKILKTSLCFIMILFTILSLTSCKKEKVVEKKFPEIVSELTSYTLEGTYITYFENGSKEANVLVYFMAPDHYRVELSGTLANEKQIKDQENYPKWILRMEDYVASCVVPF